MEERRFDALTRTLGAATSRRQLLKGALGGALAGVLAFRQRPAKVAAASACDATYCQQLADKYHQGCLDACQQMPFVSSGLGNRLCREECTFQAQAVKEMCLQGGGCAGPTHQCCGDTCIDIINDPENCGGCGQKCGECEICFAGSCAAFECPNPFVCEGGDCVCPEGSRLCQGHFNADCCQPDEDCVIFIDAHCTPKCPNCEVFNPTTKSCEPKQCGTCQVCDQGSGQCIAAPAYTPCGSGLACCAGECRPDSETCSDNGGTDSCPECQERNGSGECVPSDDGTACRSCGQCSGGTCIADPARSCETCYECNPNGTCEQVEDNTPCGSNQVCCNGTCREGESCGPCPDGPDGHLCPADVTGDATCCYGTDNPCCADDSGVATCGPTNGVCCPVGTTLQCGTNCCDLASEHCNYLSNGDGVCCPQGQSVVDDGTCCPEERWCNIGTGTVCCPSGQQCAGSGYLDHGVCCEGIYADSNGTCCTDSEHFAVCSDGSAICCGEGEDATCCANHGGEE